LSSRRQLMRRDPPLGREDRNECAPSHAGQHRLSV